LPQVSVVVCVALHGPLEKLRAGTARLYVLENGKVVAKDPNDDGK